MVLCGSLIIPCAGCAVNYTGFSLLRGGENPFVMPVFGHFIGAILSARYYYSIKIRRGPLPGPSDCPRCWVALGAFVLGGWGSVTPRVAGGAGAPPRYSPRFARNGGWLVRLRANTRLARRMQMRTPQREAEKVCRECYPGTPRRSPRRVLAEQRRGCATQATQTGATCPDGWRRPREAAGPPPYGGQRRPSTYAATGTGRQALQGWRSHRRSRLRPCKDWWAVLRLARAQPPPWAAVWIEGGAWRRPARHLCGASAASGTGAAPSRAGGKG